MVVLLAVVLLLLLWRANSAQTASLAAGSSAPLPGSNGNLAAVTQAMATYEGYYVPGSLAARTNNPGDIGTYGGQVASYPTATAGWNALNNWVSGHAAANPNWDFYDMMSYYLTGDTMGTPGPGQSPNAYAEYVAGQVGVDPTTPVSAVIG